MKSLQHYKYEGHRLIKYEGWISIAGNCLLFILKYWAGIVSGSLALIADAWHTLGDSFSSVVVIAGARVSEKPADKEHPFGHGRAELVAALIVGFLLAIIGFNFMLEAYHRLQDKTEATYGIIAIGVTIASIVIKELMAQYALWAYRKTGSKSLKADAWHHRSDAISSVIILIGIFAGQKYWWIDGVLSLIVALLIFYTAYEIIKETVSPLLGETPDPDLINQLKEICNSHTNFDTHLHHIHIHRYGNHSELTLHLCFPPNLSIQKAHDITEDIEKHIRTELDMVATIHMEPH